MVQLAIDMDQNGPEFIYDMSAIKHLYYLCIIQPCGTYLDWLL